MFDWLKRRGSRETMPEYAALRKVPNRGLPLDLKEQETSQGFVAQTDAIQFSLLEPPRRPHVESPLFVELLSTNNGVVTMKLPENGALCLPIFSTPARAADYIRTLLVDGPGVKYLSSSPDELVAMLRDLRGLGIEDFALDRCPRCQMFTTISSASMTTADDAINCWAIFKSSEFARLNLYLSHAQASARNGQLDSARDVVLETVAHVSFEDPRTHFLLGQIAFALQDRTLLHEAKCFLQFFRYNSWERRLDEVVRSGSLDFEFTA
jgi:hypothetical protein